MIMDRALLETFFRSFVALGAVLAVFGAAVWMFKKFSGNSKSFLKRAKGVTKPIEILSFQGLGPGKGLYLVRCLNKRVLIGSTANSIQNLLLIDDEEDENFERLVDSREDEAEANRLKNNLAGSLREVPRI